MLKNHFKLIIRNLWKNKLVSSINLIGLTLGIGCSLLLFMYVKYERSFDSFMTDGDRIHRLILQEISTNGRKIGLSEGNDFEDLSENYPQVDETVKIRGFNYNMFPEGDLDKKVNVKFLFATPGFFDFFDFPIVSGNQSSLLADPSSIVITEDLALKLFGHTDVIGETITVDATFYVTYQKNLMVTGVSKKMENSHIQFEAVIPWEMANPNGQKIADLFFAQSVYNYIKLSPGASADDVANEMNLKLKQNNPQADYVNYFQPLNDIYLGSNDIYFLTFLTGNKQTVNTLFYVALVILLIACINYVNLQTAKGSKRSLEVGIKKVLGARRESLITQFIGESMFITLISAILSILLIDLVLPAFNNLTAKSFTIQSLIDLGLVQFLGVIYLITSLLSGVYPALVLSSFKPTKVLKSASVSTPGKKKMRSGLMLIQFGVSICLLAITYLINQQNKFISNKQLGFNKDQVITFDLTSRNIQSSIDAFRKEIDQYPNVQSTSATTDILGIGITNNSGVIYSGLDANRQTSATFFGADHSFVDTYELSVLKGRNFDKRIATDSNAVLVNRALIESLGLEEPLNSTISLYEPNGRPYKIIGVLEDFHFQKLHQEISPVLLRIAERNIWKMSVRMSPDDIRKTLGFIESKWNEFEPESPFEYEFVDEQFALFYDDEKRMLRAITFFSTISVILTILGLFAMTVFSIEQKTKEIGIRKVLGASVTHVFSLIYKDFLVMLILAITIAAPVMYYLGSTWLDRFAYRVDLTILPILLASSLTFLIISLIVSSLVRKAAIANPADILRSE